ncbi:MAG: PEP-CTERM sorting domain-containing protein [Planctomycetaceae bacterium]|nr:PEP-CTERM sorting domain-containing protein [Planctomycetaceae bacterium]
MKRSNSLSTTNLDNYLNQISTTNSADEADISSLNQVNLQVSAVPEPSTLAMIALGGVILGGSRFVRRRSGVRVK